MKQATIQTTFEEEKLNALRRYIAKRDSKTNPAQRLFAACRCAGIHSQDDPVRKPQKKTEVPR